MLQKETRWVLALLLLIAFGLILAPSLFADSYQDALNEGEQLVDANRYDEAIQALAQAAKAQDPAIVKDACAYLGLCYDRKGDRDQAIVWYERALEKDAQYLGVLELLSSEYFAKKSDYPKGMKVAERAEALHSQEPSVYYNMACYHALAGKAELAFRYMDRAIYFGWNDVAHLSADHDFDPVRNIEPFKSLLTHLDSISAGKNLQDQGKQKSEAGANDEALRLCRDALEQYQQALGTDSLVGAGVIGAMGTLSSAMGQPDAAIGYHEKALALRLKMLGEVHQDVAASYNYLGGARYSKGEYDQAIRYFEKAQSIWTKVLGAEHLNVAMCYSNLGSTYEAKGEHDQAIGCYEKALAIRLKVLGAEHNDVAASYNDIGHSYDSKGEYARAIEYYQRGLEIWIKTLGTDHANVADIYDNLGLDYYKQGEYEKAISCYEHARVIRLKVLGAEHPDVATSYNNLGAAYCSKGEYDSAIGNFEKALSIWIKVLGAEHPDMALSYKNLGAAYVYKGEYDRAIGCFEKALAISLKAQGAEHPDVAWSYNSLGLAYESKGEYDRAIGYFEKALAIQLKVLGTEHPNVALCYASLGKACFHKGEYDRAIGYYKKALTIQLKVLGAGHPDVANSYNSLGAAYYDKGEYDQAIGYYEKALAIQLKVLGAEHPFVATSYNNLGAAYEAKGEYDRAIGYFEKALTIRVQMLGAGHPDVAQSYNNLGGAYYNKGDYDRAIGCFEKALAIRLKVLGAEHPDVAESYNNLGETYDSKGEYDRAIGYHEKALAIRLKVLGAEHPDVAGSYSNLGNAYQLKGEYDRAIAYHEKALAIKLKVLGAEHPDVAISYSNLGAAYQLKGEYDRAIAYHEKALAIRLKVLGAEHPDVAGSYNNLGAAYEDKGEPDQALNCYMKALTLAKRTADRRISLTAAENIGLLDLKLKHYPEAKKAFLDGIAVIEQARGETGGGKAEFMARNISLFYCSLVASAAMNDMSGVFDAAEAMRARGFLDRLSLSAALSAEGVSADARIKMLTLNDELDSLASQRSAEIQKPESKQDKQRLLSIVNDLQAKEKEFSDLDQSLLTNSRYKELRKPTLASLKDAQQIVADNQAILEYVLWDQENEQQAWCLVIRKSGAELVRLDESFDYSKAVTEYRDAILNGRSDREKLGAQLYEKLIASVEGKLSGVGKLIIVPDGALAFLPFDALRKDESSPYLAERYQVSLAPSVSVLRMVGARQYGVRAGRWMALGGARYSGEVAQAQRGRRSLTVVKSVGEKTKEYYAARGARAYYEALGYQWDNLPGTREEVLAVQQTVYGAAGTRVVLGEQASEQLVKQLSASGELAQQRVLHLACHGLFDAEYPAYSAVVLSEVSGALKDTSEEDGYLTVEEVTLLRLKADLVNLSACETGLGKVVKGDGVVGLTRAFLVAGANAVGATLWVVDDLATKQFMTRVYGLVEKSGMGYAGAMAQVKREFIKSKDYSEPYYWSPFVVYGK
jgi:tetratricopeptide (TPR) repeat protein